MSFKNYYYCKVCSAAPDLRTQPRFNKKPYIVRVNINDPGQRETHERGRQHLRNLEMISLGMKK